MTEKISPEFQSQIDEWFTYHKPTDRQLPAFDEINNAAKNLAMVIVQNTPRCADQSAAIRMVREARMTANAAVALNADYYEPDDAEASR